jgi:2-iminoacetate synthase
LCKLNAVLTFQEWLEDFASEETRAIGEKLAAREIAEIKARVPRDFPVEMFVMFNRYYERIRSGERDLCF